MTYFVTGGCGFIGSHFTDYLLQNTDADIVCYDKLTYAGNFGNIEHALKDPRFTFIKGDICNENDVNEAFKLICPDVVINFAAETHVDRAIKNPLLFMQVNSYGTAVLLETARKFGVRRFHQVSTDEVYGASEIPCDENAVLNPSGAYSASKASADLLALSYYKTYGLPVTVSRSCNIYGIRQYPEKLIPLTIKRTLHGLPMSVYGNGTAVRDWLHVHDVCAAIKLILDKGAAGEIYNIAAEEFIENIEVIRIIQERLIGNTDIMFTDDRLGHDMKYTLDCGKIKRLGFKKAHSLESEIDGIIEYYKTRRI